MLDAKLAATLDVMSCSQGIFHLYGRIVVDDAGHETSQEKQKVCLLA
ncbi:hypothetical protein DFR47_11110 [Pseudochrobactrum asaccharolyticum]|uniref:Uncharacterized protein n=1 Tax=Pseudochrobactrum asaccharolyticum TaxID=354351 RepID=A0A366DLV2_9HYPH|nr:hypothetical protein DFR47_11110 [Pseudochrobactrum asaccharolyticum]